MKTTRKWKFGRVNSYGPSEDGRHPPHIQVIAGDPPGVGIDFYLAPAEAREFAASLARAADDCDVLTSEKPTSKETQT